MNKPPVKKDVIANMKRIGFTGTKIGMTDLQKAVVMGILKKIAKTDTHIGKEIHHGDCVGADAEFCEMADALGFYIIVHPPQRDNMRAFTRYDESRQAKPYLVRNRQIVMESDILIAAPKEFEEVLRSGTHATIRNARLAGKPVIRVNPDGKIKIFKGVKKKEENR